MLARVSPSKLRKNLHFTGCLDEVVDLLQLLGLRTGIVDRRFLGSLAELEFNGSPRPGQALAAKKTLKQDKDILSATAAFGKMTIAPVGFPAPGITRR